MKDKLLKQYKQSSEVSVSGRKAIIVHYCCTPCHFLFMISAVNCSQSFFLMWILSHTIISYCETVVLISARPPPTCHFQFAFPVKPLPVGLHKTVLSSELQFLFFFVFFSFCLYLYTSASYLHLFFSLDCFGPHHNL